MFIPQLSGWPEWICRVRKAVEGIIAKIGFKHFVVNNDGF